MRTTLITFMAIGVMATGAFAAAVPGSGAEESGIGLIERIDDQHVRFVLPDGVTEEIEAPELAAAIKEVPADGSVPGDGATSIGDRIIGAIKNVIAATRMVAEYTKKGAVYGWKVGDTLNQAHAPALMTASVAFIYGANAFFLFSGGNPIAAIIGGLVMAAGGATIAEKLGVVIKVILATNATIIGAVAGVTVAFVLPMARTTLRILTTVVKKGAAAVKWLINWFRRTEGTTKHWLGGILKSVGRELRAKKHEGSSSPADQTHIDEALQDIETALSAQAF